MKLIDNAAEQVTSAELITENPATTQTKIPVSIKIIGVVYAVIGLLIVLSGGLNSSNLFQTLPTFIKTALAYFAFGTLFLTTYTWWSVIMGLVITTLGILLLRGNTIAWIFFFSSAVVTIFGFAQTFGIYLSNVNFFGTFAIRLILTLVWGIFVAWKLWHHRKAFGV